MYLYSGHSASAALENGKGVDEESNKKTERRACSEKSDISRANSSMYFFL